MSGINKLEEIEIIDINLDAEESDTTFDTQEKDTKAATNKEQPKGVSMDSFLKEVFSYLIVIAVAVAAAVIINKFVLVNANIPSRSMAPGINVDDKLFGFRLAYVFDEPKRGDVVIFEHQCYKNDDKEALIKRVIGVPGDTVVITDGQLYVNGEAVIEDYLSEPMVGNYGPYEVPEGCYFMLGDNRNISEDGRYWDNTYVSEDEILAKAIFKYNPSFEVIK